ncbi:hypothetical protein [Streptomyces sp. NPDC059092]|uniref:hypothetical protein n=1 Tax=Streptomyces sp. NPDC059092 TaxID=3346725 RepID=UPI0036857C2D
MKIFGKALVTIATAAVLSAGFPISVQVVADGNCYSFGSSFGGGSSGNAFNADLYTSPQCSDNATHVGASFDGSSGSTSVEYPG